MFPFVLIFNTLDFPGGSAGKEFTCNVGDLGLIPGLGRSPGDGNANPLQYSCLENSMDRGVWQITVHGVAKSLSCYMYQESELLDVISFSVALLFH